LTILRQQIHVGRIALTQPVEQPAREMGGETEIRVCVERLQKGFVAAQVGVVDYFREIAHGLVGVHAEQQGNWVSHDVSV
jgi:hypothetical protein